MIWRSVIARFFSDVSPVPPMIAMSATMMSRWKNGRDESRRYDSRAA
jgi:hypothetical protein